MKSKMCIEVSFLVGTNIEDAVLEAKNKAEQWDVSYVKFKFNGTQFSIGRNADVGQAVKDYETRDGRLSGIYHA